MTVQQTQGAEVATLDSYQMTGLEDFNLSEGMIPRVKINHDRNAWTLNIMEEQYFPTIRVVLLGMVRQRVLWEVGDLEDDAKPLCRSVGNPDPNGELFGNPSDDEKYTFPWEQSGFDYTQFPLDELKNRNLPCNSCPLKEWGSNPTPNNRSPWCAEQYTVPVMIDMNLDESDQPAPFDPENAQWMPAIITFQKTGLQPVRAYFTPFAAQGRPLFTTVTEISLRSNKKGQRAYSTPILRKSGATELEQYPLYAQQYSAMRSFLTRPFDRRSDEERQAAAAQSASQVEQAGSTPQPTPAPAPAAPTPPAAPAPAPAPAAPTPPTPPVPAATPAPAPPTPPTPPTPAPAAPAPVPQPAGQTQVVPAQSPKELPF